MELKLNYDGYEGEVVMKVATNIDRMEAMDKIGVNIMDLVQKNEKNDNPFKKMSTIIKLLKVSKKFYEKVDLKKDDRTYSSFDDLNSDPGCQHIMMDCAQKAIMGLGDELQKK